MDGKGRAIDNVMIERLWRTVKHEEVYLKQYTSGTDCKNGLASCQGAQELQSSCHPSRVARQIASNPGTTSATSSRSYHLASIQTSSYLTVGSKQIHHTDGTSPTSEKMRQDKSA